MTETSARPLNIVCLASYFKGGDFIRECKQHGCRVTLVTREKLLNEDWPRESLDDIVAVPNDASPDLFIHAVGQLARPHKLDRVIALEEYDVITAGLIREHLRLTGMGSTTARLFRDKLAMRVEAQDAGIRVPDFVHVLNYNELGEYMARVPPPWVLKPRSDVSAVGIKKMEESEQVWRAIDALDARESLRERSSYYLLERYVAGEVYHVDSLVDRGKVVFAGANKYGRPPMDVAHQGGVFISHTVKHGSREQKELFKINRKLIAALGLRRGVTHAEFIKSAEDGHFYFLEIAARVGGAYIAETLEAASGINLWRDWARIEIAGGKGGVEIRPAREEYGGVALSLARQEYPDTSAYTDPEIYYRVKKRHHVGLVVRSPELGRVTELLDQYARRFIDEFSAVVPPLERPE
jgi:biotin carboxylase